MQAGQSTTCLRERLLRQFVEPIVVLEMRRMRRRAGWIAAALAMIALGLPSAIMYLGPPPSNARGTFQALAMGYLFALVVAVPIIAKHAMARERESGMWDMLALTALKSAEIADQKIAAAATPILGLLAALAPTFASLVSCGGASVLEVISLIVVLGTTTLLVSAISVESSGDRVAIATIVITVLMFAATVGTYIVPPHIAARVSSATAMDMSDDSHSWPTILVAAVLMSVAVEVCVLGRIKKRVSRRHKGGRLIHTVLGLVPFAVIAICFVPAVRGPVGDAWSVILSMLVVCLTPVAAVRELAGDGSRVFHLLPEFMPAYAVTAGTLLTQAFGAVAYRSMAVASVERSRRRA